MLRRLLSSLAVVSAVVTAVFVLFMVLPGDRVERLVDGNRLLSEALRSQIAQQLHLDQSFWSQYVSWWSSVLHGDLGRSLVNGRPVSEILGDAIPASLRLAFWAFVIEVTVGVGLGFFVGVKRSPMLDRLSTVAVTVLLSVPLFVIGLLAQLLFAVLPGRNGKAGLAVQGIGPDEWVLGVIPSVEQLRYLLLPALCLGLVASAVVFVVARNTARRVTTEPYVTAARLRGESGWRLFWHQGLRLALVPVIGVLAVDVVALFGAAVVTETVFNWPGVGLELARALPRADVPVVLGFTVMIAVLYVVTALLAELVRLGLDPRLRVAP